MGLPEIKTMFETLATSATKRSERGILALILKDDTAPVVQTTFIYESIEQVKEELFTKDSLDYIKKAFMGIPSKIIIERIPTTATNLNEALVRLKNRKWNYLAIPQINKDHVSDVVTWIKIMRSNVGKTFKAVLPNISADDEGIINFVTDKIKTVDSDKIYSTAEYCPRIAGILAGLPFTRSSTYYKLNEVESIQESENPNKDIDDGKLILINDGEHIKIGRGVNSLTSTTKKKGEKFKKIKIIEAIDLMHDDILITFNDEYVGKFNNYYDNKVLFLTAVNGYFKLLQGNEILDPNFEAKAEINFELQKAYLESIGVNIDKLTDAQIKEYNTGTKVFVKAKGSPLDAMEDLDFSMLIV